MKCPSRCNQTATNATEYDLDWVAYMLSLDTSELERRVPILEECALIARDYDERKEYENMMAEAAFLREELARRRQQPSPWWVEW